MTAIRNYQGEVPEGTWYCQDCDFDNTNMKLAAEHSDSTSHQVWLFLDEKYTIAQFEIHPSDYDGVYLNTCQDENLTLREIQSRRIKRTIRT